MNQPSTKSSQAESGRGSEKSKRPAPTIGSSQYTKKIQIQLTDQQMRKSTSLTVHSGGEFVDMGYHWLGEISLAYPHVLSRCVACYINDRSDYTFRWRQSQRLDAYAEDIWTSRIVDLDCCNDDISLILRKEQVQKELKKYKNQFKYIEVSAQDGTNVNKLFMDIAQEIIENSSNEERRVSFQLKNSINTSNRNTSRTLSNSRECKC
ncbi:rab-type small g protein [Stylonychia lemnae]|uniref:Rab-type small g protein n=1 Tax=Stylonychia lemnae TaxID=5949 RepID=A0A077ZZX1_STYLE|nr:rab-type small g protein [Stylonychia lemnae]|eukprot:CDW75172.1 rab-type small g protein [Stylonychia lemnae]